MKKASLIYELIIHLILVALIFGLFFFATTERAGSRAVKQQVVEKQLALLIDSAEPGMSFSLNKINMKGSVDNLEIKDGKIFAYVDGLQFSKGYPYFTKFDVELSKENEGYAIRIR